MKDDQEQSGAIESLPTDEQRWEADRRSTRAWHDRLQATFKQLTEDPELLASIERRGF